MKKSTITVMLTALAAITTGCGTDNQQAQSYSPQIIRFAENSHTTPAEDLLDAEFITLEAHEESLLAYITQIFETDSSYILFEERNYTPHVFDKNGKWITRIGRIGEGPGEYTGAGSIFLTPGNKEVGVFDSNSGDILYYNIGNFKYSHKLKSKPNFFNDYAVCHDSVMYILNPSYYDDTRDYWFLTADTDMNIKHKMCKRGFTSGYTCGNRKPFYTYNGNLYGYYPYEDMTVYQLTPDTAVAKYSIEIEGRSLPPYEYLNRMSDNGQKAFFGPLFKSDYITSYEVFENDDLIMCGFTANKQWHLGFYNKHTGESNTYTKEEIEKALGIGTIQTVPSFTPGNILAITADPTETSEGVTESEKWKQAQAQAGAEGNPVIVKLSLKRQPE